MKRRAEASKPPEQWTIEALIRHIEALGPTGFRELLEDEIHDDGAFVRVLGRHFGCIEGEIEYASGPRPAFGAMVEWLRQVMAEHPVTASWQRQRLADERPWDHAEVPWRFAVLFLSRWRDHRQTIERHVETKAKVRAARGDMKKPNDRREQHFRKLREDQATINGLIERALNGGTAEEWRALFLMTNKQAQRFKSWGAIYGGKDEA